MLAVRINNLSYSMNEKKILNNINLQLEKEKIACILGPSGCGKTTLLKLIAGLSKVQEGEIFLNENLVSSSNTHLKTEKRKIGFLFQDYALFPHQTVKQNLQFAIHALVVFTFLSICHVILFEGCKSFFISFATHINSGVGR